MFFQKKYTLLCLMFFLVFAAFGQKELTDRIMDKTNVNDVLAEVDAYYATQPDSRNKEKALKHWARYGQYWSSRSNGKGEFVNTTSLLDKAMKKVPKDNAAEIMLNWNSLGPNVIGTNTNSNASINGIGRIDRLAFHPTNGAIVYAASPFGGLWKTTTGGFVWSALNNYPANYGVAGIVVSHANPDVLYVLTGNADNNTTFFTGGSNIITRFGFNYASIGVLKSTDGGETWFRTTDFAPGMNYAGFQIRQDPFDADHLFVTTTLGIFRTTDGGDSWSQVHIGTCYDIEFKPLSSSTIIYATMGGLFIRSTNDGLSFDTIAVANLCTNATRLEIAVTPDATSYVYLVAGPNTGAGSYCGVFRSTNSGFSFVRRNSTPNILGSDVGGGDATDQSWYDLCIASDPNDENNVFVGGLNIWGSGNEGSTFTQSTYYRESDAMVNWFVHPDIHDIAYSPVTGDLWAAGDGGVYTSQDGGTTWINASAGLGVNTAFRLADFDADVNVLGTGGQDNGIKKRFSSGTSYGHVNSGDGFDFEFDPNDKTNYVVSVNQRVYGFQDDTTRTRLVNTANWFMPLARHQTNSDLFFYGLGTQTNQENISTGVTTVIFAAGSWDVESCPSNSNRLYMAGFNSTGNNAVRDYLPGNGTLSRADFSGGTWSTTSLEGNPGLSFPASFKITDIAVSPTNSARVTIVVGGYDIGTGHVFQSTNAGASWTDITNDLPDVPVHSAVYDNSFGLYIGTEFGIYYRANGASTWLPYFNGLPKVPVTDLEINVAANKLRAATFGRGIWENILQSNCSVSALQDGTYSGEYFQEVSSSILSEAEIEGGAGTTVIFQAGDRVILEPGFHTDSPSRFMARLGGCGSGIPDFFEGN